MVERQKLVGIWFEQLVHLLTPFFFVWFAKWNELRHRHLISYKLMISTSIENEVPTILMNWTYNTPPHLEWDGSSNQMPYDLDAPSFMGWLQSFSQVWSRMRVIQQPLAIAMAGNPCDPEKLRS